MAPLNPYDTVMKTLHGKFLRFLGILPRNTKGTTDTGRTKTEREKAIEAARRNTVKFSTNDKFVDYDGDEFVSEDIRNVNSIGNDIDNNNKQVQSKDISQQDIPLSERISKWMDNARDKYDRWFIDTFYGKVSESENATFNADETAEEPLSTNKGSVIVTR